MKLKELVFGNKSKNSDTSNPLDRGGPGFNDEKGSVRGEQNGNELERSVKDRRKKKEKDKEKGFLGREPRDDSVMEELAEDFGVENLYENDED